MRALDPNTSGAWIDIPKHGLSLMGVPIFQLVSGPLSLAVDLFVYKAYISGGVYGFKKIVYNKHY